MKQNTIFKNLNNLIGNTPLVEISYSYQSKKMKMYAKLEWFNLTGSIKDRPALEMLKKAYECGQLKKGQTICETTSGNMGISFSAIACLLGNPVVICMPKTMSKERQELLKLYGAKLELTENFPQAFKKAEEFGKAGAFLPHQFENENNCIAHNKSTAQEIFKKLENVPCFVSGVGTGGTLMGCGKFFKEKNGSHIVAIDPAESALLKVGKSQGKHKIQGLSDEIVPKLYDANLVDEIIPIKSDDAIAMAKKLSQKLGLSVGISSGANFLGCVLSGINCATTVFADDSKKYLSTDLVKNIKSDLVDEIELLDIKTL